jgi:hypothetical protein
LLHIECYKAPTLLFFFFSCLAFVVASTIVRMRKCHKLSQIIVGNYVLLFYSIKRITECKKHSASVTKGITDCKKHSANVPKWIIDCKKHSANVTKGIIDWKHSASVTKPNRIHKAKSHYEQTTVLSLQMETTYNALELSRLPIQFALHIMIILLHHLLQ